jgi:acyl-coenzyme A synthetase/AMP-(fatty) acid ligase
VDAVLRRVASRGRRPWLVTTPLHLRTFHEALRHTAAARVIVSTMPMPVALARDVERDWDVEVHEIYGCTEGGMLAARRPAGDPRFVPAGNVRFELDTDGAARVSGGHVDAPIDVADRFERDAESGRLALIGRSADLVKIAGKRSSLAELSAILQSIPGVRDGAYLAPDPDAERVAAIVVAPLHDAASLRHALALRMDRVFLPRPLVFAAVLPRDAQGKVARAAMLALLREHRAAARPDRDLTRELCIDASHPSLPGHFPGHPLVPGVVLLERVEAMLREHGARVVAFPSVKFSRPVLPGEAFSLRVEIADNTSGRFTIAGARGLAASGTLQVEARS